MKRSYFIIGIIMLSFFNGGLIWSLSAEIGMKGDTILAQPIPEKPYILEWRNKLAEMVKPGGPHAVEGPRIPGLTMYQRMNIFSEMVNANARAEHEAEKKYPVHDYNWENTDITPEQADEITVLHKDISIKILSRYLNQIGRKHNLSQGELELISEEAFDERWGALH